MKNQRGVAILAVVFIASFFSLVAFLMGQRVQMNVDSQPETREQSKAPMQPTPLPQ